MERILFALLLIAILCFLEWVIYVHKNSGDMLDAKLDGGGNLPTIVLQIKDKQEVERVIHAKEQESLTIGSDERESEIIINGDIRIASRHCVLIVKENELYIRPIAKGCRTYINGIRLQNETLLNSDDIVKIGNTDLQIRMIGTHCCGREPIVE